MIFQVVRTSIAKKSYIFVIFRGGGGPDPLSPLGQKLWFLRKSVKLHVCVIKSKELSSRTVSNNHLGLIYTSGLLFDNVICLPDIICLRTFLLSCKPRVTVTSCFVNKVIRDL